MPRLSLRRRCTVLTLCLPLVACGEITTTPSGLGLGQAGGTAGAGGAAGPSSGDAGRTTSTGSSQPKPGVGEVPPVGTGGGDAPPPAGGTSPNDAPPAPGTNAYQGKGFLVHEWGTNTVVAGSDGSIQRGLHHEEEDLPSFVYDRVTAGRLDGSKSVLAVDVKMETPVTYFYSDAPRTVKASVGFPAGILTEWYPAAQSFYPLVFQRTEMDGTKTTQDPVLDAGHVFGNESCRAQYGAVGNGLLDWGDVEILAANAVVEPPAASRDAFTWEYARDVKANPVRVGARPGVKTAQVEKFLFYRGLGNFGLPLITIAHRGGTVSLRNDTAKPYAVPAFYLDVGADVGSFHRFDDVPAGGSLELSLTADDARPLPAYEAALGDAVKLALTQQGLFDDEAAAMVATWSRQWFRTPGRRVLYLLPQADTEAQIPLTITPKPDETVRVMMMRVEVISPELEEADMAALGGSNAEAKAHFFALGRFAEPRLRRAIALAGDVGPDVKALLATLTSAETRGTTGE